MAPPLRVSEAEHTALKLILDQLATHPGKFQAHAMGALRFRERRSARRHSKAPGPCGRNEAAVVPGSRPLEKVGEATAATEVHAAFGDIADSCLDESAVLMRRPNRSISDCGVCDRDGKSTVTASQEAMKATHSEPWIRRRLMTEQETSASGWPLPGPGLTTGNSSSWQHQHRGLRLLAGTCCIPHPEKADHGGADSSFASPGGTGVGVADGVGEWEWRFKCCPRAFADELMSGCEELLEEMVAQGVENPHGPAGNALQALRSSYDRARSFGSSTALVAVLSRNQGQLGVANIGDSGLMVLRRQQKTGAHLNFQVIGRTKEQQHAFNCPYQLSCMPTPNDYVRLVAEGKTALVQALKRNPSAKQDLPEDADRYNFQVREGDLLVLGTDGVFDNLHDQEICQLVSCAIAPFDVQQSFDERTGKLVTADSLESTEPAAIARAIAQASFERSKDMMAKSPFSMQAQKMGLYHTGGKMDDITCVCAWVTRSVPNDSGGATEN
mmetsp:Transcript_39074/g.83229  ORF Transcript_39074/g.83229 Transcript_39074/m.83229 type:complete len:498 (-) Transcript_39074:89-1582(-)